MSATKTAKGQADRPGAKPRETVSPFRCLDTVSVCAFLDLSDDALLDLRNDKDEHFPLPITFGGRKNYWTVKSLEEYVARKVKQAEKEHHS